MTNSPLVLSTKSPNFLPQRLRVGRPSCEQTGKGIMGRSVVRRATASSGFVTREGGLSRDEKLDVVAIFDFG